jgi:hypothetical protein
MKASQLPLTITSPITGNVLTQVPQVDTNDEILSVAQFFTAVVECYAPNVVEYADSTESVYIQVDKDDRPGSSSEDEDEDEDEDKNDDDDDDNYEDERNYNYSDSEAGRAGKFLGLGHDYVPGDPGL